MDPTDELRDLARRLGAGEDSLRHFALLFLPRQGRSNFVIQYGHHALDLDGCAESYERAVKAVADVPGAELTEISIFLAQTGGSNGLSVADRNLVQDIAQSFEHPYVTRDEWIALVTAWLGAVVNGLRVRRISVTRTWDARKDDGNPLIYLALSSGSFGAVPNPTFLGSVITVPLDQPEHPQ